jgi:hypothetical protein
MNITKGTLYTTDDASFLLFDLTANVDNSYNPTLMEIKAQDVPATGKLIIWIDEEKTMHDFTFNGTILTLSNTTDLNEQTYTTTYRPDRKIYVNYEIIEKFEHVITYDTVVTNYFIDGDTNKPSSVSNEVQVDTAVSYNVLLIKHQLPSVEKSFSGHIQIKVPAI